MSDSGHIFNDLYDNPAIVILPNGKYVIFYANVLKHVAYDVNLAKDSVFFKRDAHISHSFGDRR